MYFVKIILAVLFSLVMTPVILLSSIAGRERAISMTVWYYEKVLAIFGVSVSLEMEEGLEKKPEGAVFPILNHVSLLDPILSPIVGHRPFRGVVNFEFTLMPFVGWFSLFSSFVVFRQLPNQSRKTIERAVSFIKEGGNVCSTIEGVRSKDGSLSPFKKGPIVMAIKAQAPISPLLMLGSKEVLPYGSAYIRSGEVVMKMLKPISTIGFDYDDRDQFVDYLEQVARMELGLIPREKLEPLVPGKLSGTSIPDRKNGNETVSIPAPYATKSR